jgi:putative membrane protein insertion efficiency factor
VWGNTGVNPKTEVKIREGMAVIGKAMKKAIISFVLLYQKIAPEFIRGACRFEPSCSNYMIMAIEKYGSAKGILKGIVRICRCNPFFKGGIDYP